MTYRLLSRAVSVCCLVLSPLRAELPRDRNNELMLNRALINHTPELTVLILAKERAVEQVARQIVERGGNVRFRIDELGYLRAHMPTQRIDELRSLLEVVSFVIDRRSSYIRNYDTGVPLIPEVLLPRSTRPSVLPAFPKERFGVKSPLWAGGALGEAEFLTKHPTFDGRGVTVAIVEGFGDFSHPALQNARRLDGSVIPKIAGIVGTSDPYDDPDPTRVTTVPVVLSPDGSFAANGKLYLSPGPGAYRFGTYTGVHKQVYGVLWDFKRTRAWIDSNQNGSFRDETALRDCNEQFETAILSPADPSSPFRPPILIAVTFDERHQQVHVFQSDASSHHGTMTATLAVGESFFGSGVGGVAPGAQLVLVDKPPGDSQLHMELESILAATRHPKVDVVSVSNGVTDVPAGPDAFSALLLDRAALVYRKLVIIAAGNAGPFVSAFISVTGRELLTIGAYSSAGNLRESLGLTTGRAEGLAMFSSRGPDLSGSSKPDVVVPFSTLSGASCLGRGGQNIVGGYYAPPCYQLGRGTSAATPIGAGAAAVLLSAARQSGLPYDPRRLRWAMRNGARFLPAAGAHEQGGGLVQLEASWKLLREEVDLPHIESSASVRVRLAEYSPTLGSGNGLYEREGWVAGQQEQRHITFTRTSGGIAPARFDVVWQGNDGTFSSPRAIDLPLGKHVDLPIRVAPKYPGVHSGAIHLFLPNRRLPVYTTMATVVAAEEFTPANEFTLRKSGVLQVADNESLFVRIPADAQALRISLRVRRGRVTILPQMPNLEAYNLLASYQPYLYGRMGGIHGRSVDPWSQILTRPVAGVWEINVRHDDRAYDNPIGNPEPAEYEMSATVLGVSARSSDTQSMKVQVVNQLGTAVRMAGTARMGTSFSTFGSLPETSGPAVHTIQVPRDTEDLYVNLRYQHTGETDISLYLYDCTRDGHCYLWDAIVLNAGNESMLVRRPSPGVWKAQIAPFRLPTGGAKYSYQNVITNAAWGSVKLSGQTARRRSGESWTVQLDSMRSSAEADGRDRVVFVDFFDAAAEADKRDPTIANPLQLTPLKGNIVPFSLGNLILPLPGVTSSQVQP